MNKYSAAVFINAALFISGCSPSEADKKIAEATLSVECDSRKTEVVNRVVWALEIHTLGKENFEGTKELSDDAFKVAMEEEIIPQWLDDKSDKKIPT